ncbi:MAG TPA: FG-GAP-like repeat-containing protein [Gemmatimonadales bacterium]
MSQALGCGEARDRSAGDAGTILTARTLGLAYLEENRLEDARAEFAKLIQLAPKEPSGHANLGVVYLRLGRYQDAARAIERAVALAPEDPDIRLLQATVLRLTDRPDEARGTLEEVLETAPANLKALYTLADLAGETPEPDARARRRQYLARLVEVAPANVPARLALAEAFLEAGAMAEARDQLELLRQRLPELPRQVERFFADLVTHTQAGRLAEARAALARAKGALETTPVYQAGMADLRGPAGAPPGYPVLTFSARLALLQDDPRAVVNSIRFIETTGQFPEMATLTGPPAASRGAAVAAGDYDNDGHLDVFVANAPANALFKNNGDGTFKDVARAAGVADPAATSALFGDLDHDGDLDLFLGTSTGSRFYRNNMDGTFREQTGAVGLSGPGPVSGAALGDFDGDARIDLVVARDVGIALFRGLEGGRFEEVGASSGLTGPGRPRIVAAGDYDNDGSLDLFVGGARNVFYRNDGSGRFALDRRAPALSGLEIPDAAFFDFDNDGWLDLAAAGRRLVLLHNDGTGRFTDKSAMLGAGGGQDVRTSDIDKDGDLDLVVRGLDGRVRLLENDGGNANQFVSVGLVALRDGSGKNNHFGIGSRLELRAGDLYQMRVVDRPVMHFGLGNRLKADVLRVVWTNGVPQSFYYPGSDRDLLEEQVLKGSCAFLYTWDGRAYRFVTDVMWGSALGMPLGIMAGGRMAYGPPQAAREYFRVPGDQLRPQGGRYRIQITEELWEVAYLDQLALLTMDHPESVDVFVDERFVPPGSPVGGPTLHQVGRKHLLVAARDDHGRDLLPLLRAKDDVYVGGFAPGPYQGISELHDLVLDPGPLSDARSVRLFLQGWIYPTDASINVAISESGSVRVIPASLQVVDRGGGQWRTVIENLSFPAGKDKTLVIDLAGKFLSDDHRVRIRTNMEIYWDHAFMTLGPGDTEVRVTRLEPVAADIHARGFSRMFRKGGRYGPHWFDYSQVSRESPWLPIEGRYTRYGDVLPLVAGADEHVVIIAPGDEVSVEFSQTDAPPLPAGWARDFLLFNVAWMKDADLHTAAGHTVEPLPFHSMTRYPYGSDERYPDGPAHRQYVERYNTREIVRPKR